ncbi:MAG: FecR domain-containing protein, partial [Gammaproteobacteria bacterium]|nr:FecR domain-containing protein [Gammaproteobacteria bacterium]
MNRLKTLAPLLLLSSIAQAQEAGNVSFAVGDVTADRDPAVALAKDDAVFADDAIVTGDASRAQLLMIDGARIAIRPNSRLEIEEYDYAAATPSATISTTDDKSVMRLVKGGFRSITGAIGDENPEDYEVRTAVGVLGIRGTDYALLFCLADCDWAPGVAAGVAVPDGLYIMVTAGIIEFQNSVTDIVVRAGEFVFIPLDTQRPQRLDTTPPVFIEPGALRFDPLSGQPSRPDGSADLDKLSGFDTKLGNRRQPEPDQPSSSAPQPGDEDSGEAPTQSIRGTDEAGNDFDL